MRYRTHRLPINLENDQDTLNRFLNGLAGEVISIIPNYARTSILQIYGLRRKIDFLIIVEKIS